MNYYDTQQPINLRTVEDIRYRTALKLKDFSSKFWRPLFIVKPNTWWGHSRSKMCILFEIDDYGLSTKYFSHGDLSVYDMRTCTDNNLPKYLALTKENHPDSYKIILDRLEGSTNRVQYNKALTDMYLKHERQSHRYFKIIRNANKYISDYLVYKINRLFSSPHTPNYVSISLNNRTYIYNFKNRAFVSTPEKPLTTISEQDFIDDSSVNPYCAGSK